MKVIELTKDNFESEVLESKTPVVVDFNADWCGPCRMLKPIIEELSEDRSDYKFASVNIDSEDLLAERYGISSIPCVIVFENGEEVKRSIGLKPKDAMNEFLGE